MNKWSNRAKILTQDEIDQLLTAVVDGSEGAFAEQEDSFDIDAFEDFLTKRTAPERPYGIFDEDISILRFFEGGDENILADIRERNIASGYGNITIPNTAIELINYSFCPKCRTIFSFQEIADYYKNPVKSELFTSRAVQHREDTRVCCHNCGTFFLPSLIVADGAPRNEVQFLCRTQTIHAIEKFFLSQGEKVLTQLKSNIVENNSRRTIKNDVLIKRLEPRPTLIANMIQYTPFEKIMNLVDGTNIKKGDYLFNG
ncbi:MAG: hypothetical protein LBV04_01770 [Deferribacteraceae bacterium]|jgi:hypothetical protein|nr:hypothetical protein [Deferribacteraceae bacterium]